MPKRKRRRKGRYLRGDYTSCKSGAVCRYRSSWEHKYMMHLDADPHVAEWTYEKVVIEYVSNLRTKKIRKYYPDFWVRYSDDRIEVIEIKPKRKLQQAVILKKAAAAERWCVESGATYRILTEIDLKNIGLL